MKSRRAMNCAIIGDTQGKSDRERKPLDEKNATWIEPVLCCEVQYASVTPNGTLREPVFVRMRPDLEE